MNDLNKLKDSAIIVNDRQGFIETEKILLDNGLFWYGLDLIIPTKESKKYKNYSSQIGEYEENKHNTVIIPYGIVEGIKDFTGMTIASIQDLPFLIKERGIKNVIHYLDLENIINK